MGSKSISRRHILRNLTLGATAGPLLKLIPLRAAEHVHKIVKEEKAGGGPYAPKFFTSYQYKTLQSLCQTIIPPDARSGGAIEGGAPEFIDLLTSENKDYQLTLGGGLMWLDSTCRDRYGRIYLDCLAAEQKEILDQIAYRDQAGKEARLGQGIKFFALLRNLTTDGFYTSKIGIQDLQYIGNAYLAEFPGCPPLPES